VTASAMTSRRGPRAAAAAILAAALAAVLAACGSPAQHDSNATRPQPPAALGGVTMSDPVPDSIMGLPLTTADGQRTTLAAYRGKIVMIADFLTLCQDMCPMISANVLAVARQVQAAGLSGKVALLEITVDPERDTPARMAAYQKLFGGPRPDWTLLTAGTQAGTAALWKFFHVWYQRRPEEDSAGTDWLTGKKLTFDVEHSNTIIFLSPGGKQRYIADAAADSRSDLPPKALIQFMTSQGRRNLYHPDASGSWTAPEAMQILSWLAGRPIPAGSSRSPS
jgi:protein SCO1/2